MSLWQHLTRAALKHGDFPAGYQYRDLPPETPNPIQRFASRIGLPWTEARRDLKARYGLTSSSLGDFQACQLPVETIGLEALLVPGWCREHRWDSPLPPTSFHIITGIGTDPLRNIEQARDQIAVHLGPAPICATASSLHCGWQAGRSRVQLNAYPAEWRDQYSGPRHRNRRLENACAISITPRHSIPLSAQEEDWINTARPAVSVRPQLGTGNSQRFHEDCDYIRAMPEPEQLPPAWLSLSGDGRALIIRAHDLLVIPRDRVQQLKFQSYTPAKLSGGSVLSIVYLRDNLARCADEISLIELWGPTCMDLLPIAERIGEALALNIETATPMPDY